MNLGQVGISSNIVHNHPKVELGQVVQNHSSHAGVLGSDVLG